ncbi:MAG: hypothetical protein ACREU2_15410 [Steroidobacteraceae bacterium]
MSTSRPGDDADDGDEDYDDAEFTIRSDAACVAEVTITCSRCQRPFEAICIHCRSGTVFDEPLREFTVSNIHRLDPAMAEQLRAWPNFRPLEFPQGERGDFANHCPSCGSPCEDTSLHDEPGDPFFDIPHAPPGTIRFTALADTVQLSGDEHYDID